MTYNLTAVLFHIPLHLHLPLIQPLSLPLALHHPLSLISLQPPLSPSLLAAAFMRGVLHKQAF